MKKYLIFFIAFFIVCNSNNETTNQEEVSSPPSTENSIENNDESTTTTTEIVQLESFKGTVYVIQQNESRVSYLAPKQFFFFGLETVEGITSEIIG